MDKKLQESSQNNIRYPNIQREYKDRMFRKVFEDKKDQLDLYNAINGTNYTNPEELVVTTLEDVIFLGMKNDRSFLIGDTMNLYEHTSTWCPNLPLRGLMYFARVYEQYVESQEIRIYGTKQILLPTPQYIVFYNGTREEPDRAVLTAVDECIEKGILKELLVKCKSEVIDMILSDFNQEEYEKTLLAEGE